MELTSPLAETADSYRLLTSATPQPVYINLWGRGLPEL